MGDGKMFGVLLPLKKGYYFFSLSIVKTFNNLIERKGMLKVPVLAFYELLYNRGSANPVR